MVVCPDDDSLAAFVQGSLQGNEAATIEKHIDGCESCRQVLGAYGRVHASDARGRASEDGKRRVSTGPDPVDDEDGPTPGLAFGTAVGRYLVLERIGEGGMGVVYEAYDPKLDRRIALKIVNRSRAKEDGEGGPDALVREAQVMAKLAHPNVVAVYDVGTFDGGVFIAMELVEGLSVRHWWLGRIRHVDEVLSVFVQASRGLAAAHAIGIVHRDVKPENILVDEAGRARITDFGLARPAPRPIEARDSGAPLAALASSVVGTPAYMAPEVLRGQAADARSDQYGYCVALHEALCGIRPGEGISPDVPRRMRTILQRGLSREPEARYPSMDRLLADLLRVRRSFRPIGLLAFVGVALAAGLAWNMGEHPARVAAPLCGEADARLARAWNDDRKMRIERAFVSTGRPGAADASRRAAETVDRYARDWAAARLDACEATHERGEQSEELLDLRTECYGERLSALASVADVLEGADDEVVQRAPTLVEGLPPLGPCSDRRALTMRARPADAQTTAAVAGVREQLAQVRTLDRAGKYSRALSLAAQAVAAADAAKYPPAQAEATYWFGRLQGRTGDWSTAEGTLTRAEWAADAVGDDLLRLRALGELLEVAVWYLGKHDKLAALRGEGEAAISRAGVDDEAVTWFYSGLGTALQAERDYRGALAIFEKELALQEKLFGEESLQAAVGSSAVANASIFLGDYDRGIANARRVLEIYEAKLGPDHPDVALTYEQIGGGYIDRVDAVEAETWFRKAVDAGDRALGPEHPIMADYLDNLGASLSLQGRYEDAVPVHQRALAIREKLDLATVVYSLSGLGQAYVGRGTPEMALRPLERALAWPNPPSDVDDTHADVEFALAKALSATGKGTNRARALALEARDAYRKSARSPLQRHNLTDIERWLAGASPRSGSR